LETLRIIFIARVSMCVVVVVQGCMPNGCCHSGSVKLVADQQARDTYVTHDGHVASCALLNSSTNCSSSHRVRH